MPLSFDLKENAGKLFLYDHGDYISLYVKYYAQIDNNFTNGQFGVYRCEIGEKIFKEDLPITTDHMKILSKIIEIIPSITSPYRETLEKAYSYEIIGLEQISEEIKRIVRFNG